MNHTSNFTKLIFRHNGKKIIVNSTEIILLSADINYTVFHLKNGTELTSSSTILKYDSYLNQYNFFRINRKHIINLLEIKGINYQKFICTVELKNGMSVQTSRRKNKAFLDLIEGGGLLFQDKKRYFT